MRAEISKLHKRLTTTIIYVTHDQVEAMTLADKIIVMNHGSIMQEGPPSALYDTPNSLFVAGFIGSPSMNFISVYIKEEGGRFVLDGKGISIAIPNGYGLGGTKYIGREAIFGIRPVHIQEEKESGDMFGREKITGLIEVVEPMGAETILVFKTGDYEITAKINDRFRRKPGETASFLFNMNETHLFEPTTGCAIR